MSVTMLCINFDDEKVASVAQMSTELHEFNLQVSFTSIYSGSEKTTKLKHLTSSIDLHPNIRRIASHSIASIFILLSLLQNFFALSLPLFAVFFSLLLLLLLYLFSSFFDRIASALILFYSIDVCAHSQRIFS